MFHDSSNIPKGISVLTSAIILAAGQGSRMSGYLGCPKPLAPINGEPLLQRNLRQMHEIGAEQLIVVTGYASEEVSSCARSIYPFTHIVHNPDFASDLNLQSALIGLKAAKGGVFLLEGDVALADAALPEIQSFAAKGESFWTSCGKFHEDQKGGILSVGPAMELLEIKYADWIPELSNWYKNLGLIYISPDHVQRFIKLLEEMLPFKETTYFMSPWAENLQELPAFVLDLGERSASFNTPEEYKCALAMDAFSARLEVTARLLAPQSLLPIEKHDRKRAQWLKDSIVANGIWTKPIVVSDSGRVMDGHHRLSAALALGLRSVPCVVLNYTNIHFYSLRPEISITLQDIETRSANGNIYPYKTVKHILPSLPDCFYSIEELLTREPDEPGLISCAR